MLFTHDTEIALRAMEALVDTEGPPEALGTPQDLARFLDHWRISGDRAGDQGELDAVRALRTRLRRLWHVPMDEAVLLVNALLQDGRARPKLVRHDEYDYHVHATPPDAPLPDRLAVDAAMAMVDVIRQQEFDRLRSCAAPWCRDVIVDLSKNRSRRFCGATCANRVNVAAFRARRSAGGARRA